MLLCVFWPVLWPVLLRVFWPVLLRVFWPVLLRVFWPVLLRVFWPVLLHVFWPVFLCVFWPVLLRVFFPMFWPVFLYVVCKADLASAVGVSVVHQLIILLNFTQSSIGCRPFHHLYCFNVLFSYVLFVICMLLGTAYVYWLHMNMSLPVCVHTVIHLY